MTSSDSEAINLVFWVVEEREAKKKTPTTNIDYVPTLLDSNIFFRLHGRSSNVL